jgi:predicted amidohydrolase YtcJ
MDAIRCYTIHSAYAGFEEKIKGSIESGKLADLIVISDDPINIPVDRIKDIKVLMTIIDGRIVYKSKDWET